MTKYQYIVNKNSIEENGKFVAYLNSVDGFKIANKLNVLSKENEQLKQQNSRLMMEVAEYSRKVRELEKGDVK